LLDRVPMAAAEGEDRPDLDPVLLAERGLLPGGRPLGEVLEVVAEVRSDSHPRVIEVPTTFDGPDLEEVAEYCGLDVDGLVEAVQAAELRVEVLGFSPGFAYLGGLSGPLAGVPRRAVPRPSVPAGSVALAGGFAAVYPQATPGGWQLIGRTSLKVFDPDRSPYATFQPGDRVRFVAVTGRQSDPLPTAPPTPVRAAPRLVARECLLVEETGFLTLVQDGGRRGVAHLGVPRAGPADPHAHALANRLVGNPPQFAALEITGRGPALRCLTDVHVAVVGGSAEPEIDGHRARACSVVPVAAGQRLTVGSTGPSLRAVLAVAGGLIVESAFGSFGTDTLSWTGRGPLRGGDVLFAGPAPSLLGGHLAGLVEPPGPGPRGWVMRILGGPHAEWFAGDALEQLAASVFVVDPMSDRVGLRLDPVGEGPALGRRAGELVSQPMLNGAVQVPPSGKPVVLGPDHATLGGYPVIATVITADLGVPGRCRAGDRVRFVPVDAVIARGAAHELQRHIDASVVGHFPTAAGT
jgi:KipI family sensor histidine kinase inhibitor